MPVKTRDKELLQRISKEEIIGLILYYKASSKLLNIKNKIAISLVQINR